jgi:peptidoglycan biosynthesis protein MviN/MurJ (putative lipid II flippase)
MSPVKVIMILALLLGILLALALAIVGNHAVDKLAEQASQPVSATELILRSRETAPVTPSNSGNASWLGAGLLALLVVVIGGLVFAMQGGAQFLRQLRLLRKRQSRHARRRYTPDYLPPNTDWPEIRNTPSVRYLPEVDDEQMVESFD